MTSTPPFDKKALLNELQQHSNQQPTHNKGNYTRIIAGIFLLLIAFVTYTFTTSPNMMTDDDKTIVRVDEAMLSNQVTPMTKEVIESPEGLILEASGYITPRRVATVAAQTSGLIIDLFFDEGTQVKQGDVLANIDNRLPIIELSKSEARAETFEATINIIQLDIQEAMRQLENVQRLATKQYTSDDDVAQRAANLNRLEASLVKAKLEYQELKLSIELQRILLANYSVIAPFDGMVIAKNAQLGEIISPGSAGGGYTRTGICTIVDMSSLEIVVDVNESLISKIKPGQRVEAELYAHQDWQFEAEVLTIIPAANRAKATVRVRIKLLETDPRILPDMAVKVSFYQPTITT